MRRVFSVLMAAVLALSLGACGKSLQTPPSPKTSSTTKTQITGSLLEVAPPSAIQQLSQSLALYQPQVSIISPQADAVLQETNLTVQLQVQDLPIFQDPDLGMGPHLEVILDNNPYTMVYDLKQPLVLPDLAPGTHTLRVIAATPWHESFKNDGAYAQTTFHIFTKTSDNNPAPALPLLTYIRPTGSYGAEPILLDFYLTNAPLHLVAQEKPDDNIADWRIRATVNGQSFILDRWESVYLKGFKPGKNWVQLEYLDEQGNPVKNVFNNSVRLIDYQPKGKDTLSKLVRGELTSVQARGIVEQGAQFQPTPVITPEEIQTEPETVTPTVEATPETEPTPTSEPEIQPKVEPPKSGGFFGRFRRQPETPSPKLPEQLVVPTPEPMIEVVPPKASETLEEPVIIPTPETTQPESQPKETPKLDLKEVLIAPPASTPKIIIVPKTEAEIPERFLKKAPVEKEQEQEILEPLEASPVPDKQEVPEAIPELL